MRLELLGDTIESIRTYDANTQRSTSPIERTTLLPLTEFPLRPELFAKVKPQSSGEAHDGEAPLTLFPGWEFREVLREERKSSIFDLAADPVIIIDEPSLLAAALEKYRTQLAEGFDKAEDPLAEPPTKFIFDDEEWTLALEMAPRLALERLGLTVEPAAAGTDSGERSHCATRARAANPPNHKVSRQRRQLHRRSAHPHRRRRKRDGLRRQHRRNGAPRGHLPRIRSAVPRWAKWKTAPRSHVSPKKSSGRARSAIVLTKAPLTEGVVFDDAKVALYGNADLFETLPAPSQRSRARPENFQFFQRLSAI